MLLSTLTGLLTLWSCNNTLSENTEHDRVITFDLKTADCGVKSSIDLAEDKIVNINIFAFSDGIACGHLFTEESSRAKIILPSGEFTVYIAANLGKMKDFATEKELSEWRYRIDASSALAGKPALNGHSEPQHKQPRPFRNSCHPDQDGRQMRVQVQCFRYPWPHGKKCAPMPGGIGHKTIHFRRKYT